jgi:hypothetical protein
MSMLIALSKVVFPEAVPPEMRKEFSYSTKSQRYASM